MSVPRSPSTPLFSPSASSSLVQGDNASSSSARTTSCLAASNSSSVDGLGSSGRLCSTGISHNLGKLSCDVSASSSGNVGGGSGSASGAGGGLRSPSVASAASCVTPISSGTRSLRGLSSSSARRMRAARLAAAASGTPRPNPFDSMLSSESLKLPILSPSVFATVESPSQQSTSGSGRFWSVEQQASLFPAAISDDSPWKQANATSVLDPETENKTQEAINMYFSQNHQIESPEMNNSNSMMAIDAAHSTAAVVAGETSASSSLLIGEGGIGEGQDDSPVAVRQKLQQPGGSKRQQMRAGGGSRSVSRSGSFSSGAPLPVRQSSTASCSQWSQTELTLPPVLPREVQEMLQAYFTFNDKQGDQLQGVSSNSGTGGTNTPLEDQQAGNLSTSTLRRKLFEGHVESSSEDDDDDVDESGKDKENHHEQQHLNIMSSPIRPPSSSAEAAAASSEEGNAGGCRLSSPPQPLAITPISKISRISGKNPKWSSSPISAKVSRRTSHTPPAALASPAFSPVCTAGTHEGKRKIPHPQGRIEN